MGRKKSQLTNQNIVSRVKQYRREKGWSQEELAERLNIGRQAVYDIESGKYLPNTAIALRLARIFACRVEDLFVEHLNENEPVHLVADAGGYSSRLLLGRVRDKLVGFPLSGPELMPFGLRPADGTLDFSTKSASLFSPPHMLEKTLLLLGCDPAFEILAAHVARVAPQSRVHCCFASTHRALDGLAQGVAHVGGTHLHNREGRDSNVLLARQKLPGTACHILGFSIMEEGLMVAGGNPLGLAGVDDLIRPGVCFVNREPGAALRILLDDQLQQAGIEPKDVRGYENEVFSHSAGAFRVAGRAADAALGLRIVAEMFGLDFVPLAEARCDLVIPADVMDHPTLRVLLDVLQSAALRREIAALGGYASTATGKVIDSGVGG